MRKAVFAAMVITMAAGAIFFTCKKDAASTAKGSIKTHKSSMYYDNLLLARLMQEPIVGELQRCINSMNVTVVNGTLRFPNLEISRDFYDTLVYFSQKWDKLLMTDTLLYQDYINSDEFPVYPMLYAFETLTGFYSLRAALENEVLALEAGEGIDLNNDPSDHYIVSPYLQAILNPNCEVIISTSVFITGEEENEVVEIPAFGEELFNESQRNRLSNVRNLINQFGMSKGLEEACLTGNALQNLGTPTHKNNCCDEMSIKCNIKKDIKGCPNTYEFYVFNDLLACEGIHKKSYEWYFGPGAIPATSRDRCPTVVFNQQGNYNVTVRVTKMDGSICDLSEFVTVSNCAISFTKHAGNKGDYTFRAQTQTPLTCDGATPVSYLWNFGDGSPEILTQQSEVKHTYTLYQEITVFLTTTFSNGCVANYAMKVLVTDPAACCKAYDAEREKDIRYCSYSSKTIKHVFAIRNFLWWHNVVVKSIHYRYKSNGNKVRDKADFLKVGYDGQLYLRDCSPLPPTYKDVNYNKKCKEVSLSHSIREPFRTMYHSIWSYYGVIEEGNSTQGEPIGLYLHNKPCK
jgi:hypothetical protein